MRPHLAVKTDPEGRPYAEIPQHCVWELVEYFNYGRPNVTYHFDRDFFKVTFHGQSVAEAQRLLDRWSEAEEVRREHALS